MVIQGGVTVGRGDGEEVGICDIVCCAMVKRDKLAQTPPCAGLLERSVLSPV